MIKVQFLKPLAWIILLFGGVNWILVGLVNVNLIAMLLGNSKVSFVIDIVVGLVAIYAAVILLSSSNKK